MYKTKQVETKVAGYSKTEHFIYRQWDRGVTDRELSLALNKLDKPRGKQLLVVSRKLIRKCANKKCLDLFIKVKGRVLVTCFYCDFQDYLNGGKKENYLLIS